MTNHLHLLMTPATDRGASLLMQGLGQGPLCQARSIYINRTYRRTGTPFEGRFRSSVIEADSDLLACQGDIELNPVRARMAASRGR
jgi:putative transposase